MFENQIATLTTILKDKDIHNYMGDTFWNIIKAVSLGDMEGSYYSVFVETDLNKAKPSSDNDIQLMVYSIRE